MLLLPLTVLFSCSEEKTSDAATAAVKETYTCPMHPQVVQHEMGTCPVCGMDLVRFEKGAVDAGLQLNEQQKTLANVKTMTIGDIGVATEKQLNGRLVANPEQTSFISSRVAGRLDRLFVRQTGEQIKKGQPLYQIYSEQLATLQQEFLLAVEQSAQFPDDKTFTQIFNAARQKLQLYGQSEGQIKSLQHSRKISPNITFFAPGSGTVAELSVNEGQYVAEGSPLLRLEGYQSLWVEADIYASELGRIKEGQPLRVVVPGWEDQPKQVKVSFINPALQPGAQLLQIRATLPNPDGRWQPGLQAKVFVEQTGTGKRLTLPQNAVIRNGQGAHVWLETKTGHFEPRIVETGLESAEGIAVTSGLQSGDKVVISGAYLLYSEYVLKKGKDPMAAVHKS
jgi:Cu(I)/Ag(I) efflux system membrane fusion protein